MQLDRRNLLILFGWTALLLASSQVYPSFMAHDEGNYALESRFMLESGEWLGRRFWDSVLFTHGILLNWLIMLSYQLFDLPSLSADWAVRVTRLPTFSACLLAVALTYMVGKQIFEQQRWPYAQNAARLGLLSGLLIMLFPVWMQFSHLATQDIMLVSVELLAIWALLRAEVQTAKKKRLTLGFLAGTMFGLGFLIKTFMVVLPAIALLPYLIFEQRRHRHLTNWGIYIGLIVGFIPAALWIGFSVAQYGSWVLDSMFGKLVELSDQPYHSDGGLFYYFWNIPVNMFPWALFSVIGAGIVLRQPRFWTGLSSFKPQAAYPHRWLLLYPFILTALLMAFATKTPYYALQLHPFLAWFAAVGLYQIATQPLGWPRHLLSYSFSALGLIVVGIAIASYLISFGFLVDVRPYAPIGLVLGIGWALLPVFQNRAQQWLATWLVPVWLALGMAGVGGFLGNYSARTQAAATTEPIASLVQDTPMNFILSPEQPSALHKDLIILAFHTPRIGQLNPPIETMSAGTYVWVGKGEEVFKGEQLDRTQADVRDGRSQFSPNPISPGPHGEINYETVIELDNWRLIRL
ncbi:dolichyl-phosphate-mannose-protein mannosyltransferase [Synechococcus sp. PCC 7335]|uniref:ArnT family glycosyltransferase n=1 Tax=Synechococcus sp. (strain ATCC 29403 / PCC 7335) TaxID=91464 RepID=UPI00017ED985|nr:glycosyltransferase family 39 protein [Synechococcus sp. PCC 7335]EDX85525.1 dolichyl-phosphate-mannose-protein mannosyltransferase [Synechococcus sp. PCC 7335]